ncbi:MAG TPA: anti-sigma factor domain-containing protein [Anaerovoracaceae bacterium]|nr:anti-sigma factor domain-containing protein [Anaerovoracaceae bacterium]
MKQGIVIKINNNHAIVLSQGEYLKVNLKEQMLLGQRISFTDEDIYKEKQIRRGTMNLRRAISVAAVFVLVFVGSLFVAQEDYASLVVIDINPSVQLELDEDEFVTGYEALNEDAETLELDYVMGMTVEDAVSYITQKAEELGFIDLNDLDDDYVLVATISDDEDVEERLQDAAIGDENLEAVNVAMIKATKEQLEEALQLRIPLGLLVSGKIDNLEEGVSVQDFFDNEELMEKFMEAGYIIKEDYGHKLDRVNAHLIGANIDDTLKDELMIEFLDAKDAFFDAKESFTHAREAYKETLKNGDENEIALAKAKLEEAELYKDLMEQNKDNVEATKEALMKNLEGEFDKDDMERELEKVQKKVKEKNEKAQQNMEKAQENKENALQNRDSRGEDEQGKMIKNQEEKGFENQEGQDDDE